MNKTLTSLIRLKELTGQSEHDGETTTARQEIEGLRHKLLGDVLRRFDHLTNHGRRPVAPLSPSGACGSCHIKLPPSDVLRLRSSSHSLPTCPFCGCFLYAPETEPETATANA